MANTDKETVHFSLVANIVLQLERWFNDTTSTGGYQLRFRILLVALLLWRGKLPNGRRSQGWRVLPLGLCNYKQHSMFNLATAQSSIVSILRGQRLLSHSCSTWRFQVWFFTLTLYRTGPVLSVTVPHTHSGALR